MKNRFLLLRWIEILLWSLAIGLPLFYVLKLLPLHPLVVTFAPIAATLILFIVISRKLGLFNIKDKNLALYINRQYPQLEESADLLLQEDNMLTSLQQLQKAKIIDRFETIYPPIKLPHHLGRAMTVFTISTILSAGLIAFSIQPNERPALSQEVDKFHGIDNKSLPTFIKSCTITISPPAYTATKNQMSSDFNLKIPENSTVTWKIVFQGEAITPEFIFSARDTIQLVSKEQQEFKITRTFQASGFYQIAWTTSDNKTRYSDYFKIEIIKDNPPKIVIENLNQFVELSLTDNLKLEFKSILTDDYGIRKGHIIATVSKGSGEAIKFREEKLSFDQPPKIAGKRTEASKTMDLLQLGLQPGDEIYFYVEAFDNKHPVANQTRTETYFISLQDTSSQISSMDVGLGVDLMPEYFRSQRQIIIDSEKLLREKKRITKQNFNTRSNELGYDQKVLRLRYGEFLGEAFESAVGPHEAKNDGTDEDEDVIKKFGHSHDTENEHNLVDEKNTAINRKDHNHKGAGNSAEKLDPLKEFVHAHEGEEEATFFVQSIKTKLKAAVTIMWDAELYLRLNQPEKSLPYQYQALKLLKEISQDSRIYVHRTGFDPPPLKEEKRLTGDLSEIKNSTFKSKKEIVSQYPAIRNALFTIEELMQYDSIVISAASKDTFNEAGHELAVIALQQPGRYLESLSLLKRLTAGEISGKGSLSALNQIRSTFWEVLPQEVPSPQATSGLTHQLDLQFLKNLEALKQNN